MMDSFGDDGMGERFTLVSRISPLVMGATLLMKGCLYEDRHFMYACGVIIMR